MDSLAWKIHKDHLVRLPLIWALAPSNGLAVKNLFMFDRALLGKWLWHYVMGEGLYGD